MLMILPCIFQRRTTDRHSTQQELRDSRRDAIGRLTSDLSLVSD